MLGANGIELEVELSQREEEHLGYLRGKFSSNDVSSVPWPHFRFDGVLPPDVFRAIREHWPSTDGFDPHGTLAGQELLYLSVEGSQTWFADKARPRLDDRVGAFWSDFIADWSRPLVLANLEKFAWIVSERFGGEVSLPVPTFCLMQHRPDYVGQDAHNHYNHNVNWIFTFLIYVNDDTDEEFGTSIFDTDSKDWYFDNDAALRYTGPFGHPSEGTHIASVAGYRANRMISMVESPLALHGGDIGTATQLDLHRRVLRWHVPVSAEDVQRAYGCSRSEFLESFSSKQIDPELWRCIERDLNIARVSSDARKYRDLEATTKLIVRG
jgi:hypothetical protein